MLYEVITAYLPEFEHPLWEFEAAQKATVGHGGMDYLEDYRLIKCLREGLPTDMTVYDAAALSAVTALSEWSVANRSRPVDFVITSYSIHYTKLYENGERYGPAV